jgi:mono/diheme cytochrome c family protein
MAGDDRSSDHLWLWFALSSVVCLAVLAVSPIKDYLREYRHYQTAYRTLLFEQAGSAEEVRKAASQTVGIRQIWMPDFDNRVDRCVTCHLGIENPRVSTAPEPFGVHPVTPHSPDDLQRFGCVICHRGQGRATSRVEAHGEAPDWDSPLLPLRYTEASCGRCHDGDSIPEASLLSTGRALVRQAGCFGCHEIPGRGTWRSGAPDLNGLNRKTSPEWLMMWLKSPRNLQPGTWMPDFHLSDAEADALVAFLWDQAPTPAQTLVPAGDPPPGDADAGGTLFRASRCITCHTLEGRGNGSAPELSGIGSKVNRRWLVAFLGDPHAFQPHTEMPRYNFSRQDRLDMSQYLVEELVDPSIPAPGPPLRPALRAVQEGERIYRKYGCGGCHRLAGREDDAPIGPDLSGIGDKPAALLDFGDRDDLLRTLPDWLAAKVSAPRTFRDNLKMPDFHFTSEQVQAIVTALLSHGRLPVPQKYQVAAGEATYAPPGRFGKLVEKYRCMSCHLIQGAGGDISTAPLGAEGSRVRREWLARYMLHPSTIRPILTDRMIPLRLTDEEAGFIADFIANVYVDNDVPGEIVPGGPSADRIQRGRQLFFERHGCQACHMVGNRGGYFGPLLDGAGDRLEPGWILWWLRGPQRWRADVRCPDYGLDEEDARDLAAYVASIPAATPAPGPGSPGGGP